MSYSTEIYFPKQHFQGLQSHQPSLQKVQFPGSKSLAPAEGGD